MEAEIYGPYSTRDGRVRYVGQSGDSALRLGILYLANPPAALEQIIDGRRGRLA
jgi:hypothetical protein